MDITLRLTIFILGVTFDIIVFYLLVTRRINERASLPWIAGSFVIMFFTLMPDFLGVLANALGVDYPPALIFLIAILIILLLLLYQSIHISILENKCRELAQNLAIISSIGNIELQTSPMGSEPSERFVKSISSNLPLSSQEKQLSKV